MFACCTQLAAACMQFATACTQQKQSNLLTCLNSDKVCWNLNKFMKSLQFYWNCQKHWNLLQSIEMQWNPFKSVEMYRNILTRIEIYWYVLNVRIIEMYWNLFDMQWFVFASCFEMLIAWFWNFYQLLFEFIFTRYRWHDCSATPIFHWNRGLKQMDSLTQKLSRTHTRTPTPKR